MFERIAEFIKSLYQNQDSIQLHTPVFLGEEKEYLNQCIDSTFVSTVGPFVVEFEKQLAAFTGAKYVIPVVNGTSGLHLALMVSGVKRDEEVLTQAITFVATANAIRFCGAQPVIIDCDRNNLGMCPEKLRSFLATNTTIKNGVTVNKINGKKISACVPVHIFGHAVAIDEIIEICNQYSIPVVEDAAEALGSYKFDRHLGTIAQSGVLSFNGNKILTTGGGGAVLTNDPIFAQKAKHISTTARTPHQWEFLHDEVGYNYRMPNLNASIGCAQMKYLDRVIRNKRETANLYSEFFKSLDIPFIKESENTVANYWLNAILLKDESERNSFLAFTHQQKIMARPLWPLINELDMYKNCVSTDLTVSKNIRARLVNLPSSFRTHI